MKKSIFALITFFTVFILFAASFYGCKKNDNNDENNAADTTKISGFFNQNMVASQFFDINAGVSQYVTGNKGTKIYIFANTFLDQSNHYVSGTVHLELKEIYSKKDMILSNVTTTASDGHLISGGMVYVNAKQNGNQLKIAPNKYLGIAYPKPASITGYPMRTWYGKFDVQKNMMVWNLPDSISDSTYNVVSQPVYDSTNSTYYYNLPADSLNWINCDYFYSQQPLTDVTVTVPSIYNDTNTALFIVFSNMNLAAKFWNYNNHVYNLGGGYNVPVGINATVISVSQVGTDLYSSFNTLTIHSGQTLTVAPVLTTQADLITQLNALP
jgi:hypothetical protein